MVSCEEQFGQPEGESASVAAVLGIVTVGLFDELVGVDGRVLEDGVGSDEVDIGQCPFEVVLESVRGLSDAKCLVAAGAGVCEPYGVRWEGGDLADVAVE